MVKDFEGYWEADSLLRENILDGITDSMDMSLSKLQELVMDRKAWHAAVHVVTNLQFVKKIVTMKLRC